MSTDDSDSDGEGYVTARSISRRNGTSSRSSVRQPDSPASSGSSSLILTPVLRPRRNVVREDQMETESSDEREDGSGVVTSTDGKNGGMAELSDNQQTLTSRRNVSSGSSSLILTPVLRPRRNVVREDQMETESSDESEDGRGMAAITDGKNERAAEHSDNQQILTSRRNISSVSSSLSLTPVLRPRKNVVREDDMEIESRDQREDGQGMAAKTDGKNVQESDHSNNKPVLATRPGRNVVSEELMETESSDESEDEQGMVVNREGRNREQSELSDNQPGSETQETSIFEALQKKETSVEELCSRWMEKFSVDNVKALVELLQFVIHSTGCKGVLTEKIMTKHIDVLLKDFVDGFPDDDDGSYPLIRPGKSWQIFRHNFSVFFYQWTKRMGKKFFVDKHSSFVDGFNLVILAMTDHQVRNYRHAATLAVIKMMSAFIAERLNVSMKIRDKERQLGAEHKKRLNERSTDRINALRAGQMALEEEFEEYKGILEFYHKAVFLKRFRDVCPEIRVFCISALGSWMKKFPEEYVQDSYLNLISATLTDPTTQVRSLCLEYLLPLYMDEELKEKLRLFTSKCKNRLMSMTVDANADVSEKAIRLVAATAKTYSILETTDVEIIFKQLYAADRRCAVAAAEFLSDRLFVLHSETSIDSPKKTAAGKNRRPNTPLIRDLVDFFIESDLPSHAAYLVDAMIDIQPLLKDWATMTDLLLEEPGPEEQALTEVQEANLINIMICAVKQAATGMHPEGRAPKSKMNARALKQVASGRLSVTNHFMETLPKLLSKYQTNEKNIANLLTIPNYFDVKLYTTSRQQSLLKSLLDIVKETVEHHSSREVIEVATKALEILCLDERNTTGMTEASILQVLEAVAASLLNSHQSYKDRFSAVAVNSLCTDIQKIAIVSESFDLNSLDIWSTAFEVLRSACSRQQSYPVGVVKDAISSCYFALVWSLKSIKEYEEEDGVDEESVVSKVHELQKRVKRFLVVLRVLMSSEFTHEQLKDSAFTAICDTFVLFSKKDGAEFWKEDLTKIDQSFVKLITGFLIDTIFEAENIPVDISLEEVVAARNMSNVTLFCKLLIFKVIESKDAADIFQYYLKFFSEYGDIFKATLEHIRKTDQVMFSNLLIEALKKLYEDSNSSDDIMPLYNLAQRFSLLFGVNASKYQPALIALHREGVHFVVNSFDPKGLGPPVNLSFLNALCEFSGKLTTSSKQTIYQYLNQRFNERGTSVDPSNLSMWTALLDYRKSLGFDTNSPSSQPRSGGGTPAARARQAASRPRRRVKRLQLP